MRVWVWVGVWVGWGEGMDRGRHPAMQGRKGGLGERGAQPGVPQGTRGWPGLPVTVTQRTWPNGPVPGSRHVSLKPHSHDPRAAATKAPPSPPRAPVPDVIKGVMIAADVEDGRLGQP